MLKNIPGHFGYKQINNWKIVNSSGIFGEVLWSPEKGERVFDFTSFPTKMEVLLYTLLYSYNTICLALKTVYIALKISRDLFKTKFFGTWIFHLAEQNSIQLL